MPWHPAVVHIPITLLLLAVAIDVTALLARREGWHDLAWRLMAAGTLGALAAVISGDVAAAAYRDHEAVADLIQQHEDAATLCLLLFGAATLGRLPLALGRSSHRRWRPAWIGVAAVAALLLVYAGHLGGELVFLHGVGVQPGGVSLPGAP